MYVRPDEVLEVLNSLEFNIYCKSDGDSFGYARVHSCIVDRYVFRKSTNISICKSLQVPLINLNKDAKRQLHIQSVSDITILPKVVINGNGTETLRVGGMIRIISNGTVTNHGKLCCNGMTLVKGGAIYIVADAFLNKGHIECVPHGQIKIYCRGYHNGGTIRPEPDVIYFQQPTRHLTFLADYPMSVIDYFMYSLQSYNEGITIPTKFYKLIGVQVVAEWIPWIARHELLFRASQFEGMMVIERLRNELKLSVCPRGDHLLNEVSYDDTLSQADDGVKAFDKMKEVIRSFSEHQQSRANRLQEIYTNELTLTYWERDQLTPMKEVAEVSAHVHELIVETVSAQKRLADFLLEQIVPQMSSYIKVYFQCIELLFY